MKARFAALSLSVLSLVSLIVGTPLVAEMPPDNVEGNWTIYSTNVDNNEVVIKHVQIAQYGNRITGYFEGPNQSGPIQGRIDVHHIVFSTVTRNVLTFRGQIYGNNMSGLYGIHGRHAPWQAVRTTGVTPVPQSSVTYVPEVVANEQPILAPPGAQETPAEQPAATQYQQPQQQYANQPQYQAQPADYQSQQPAQYDSQQQYSQPQQQQSYSPQYQQQASQSQPSQQYASDVQPGDSAANSSNAQPAPAPLTSDQLNALVAPIALYPDSLVAQVLAASMVPDEVAAAENWLTQNSNLTGSSLTQAVDQQSWDPSVKALTQFPTVLASLASNLSWTSSLGQAFHYQQSDVMAAVQAMRAKAQAAGTLQSNSQQTVSQSSPGVIVIQPTNPQVVYVPQYNPTVVYGAPVVVPYYTPAVAVAAATVSFGPAISIGAFYSSGGGGGFVGGGFGWGFNAWACNWGGGGGNTIIFNHNTYINNNTWYNNHYNGYHPWGPGPYHPYPYGPHPYSPYGNHTGGYYGPNGYYHPDPGWRPGTDTHYGPNGAYHPNGYFGPDGGWHPDAPGTNPARQPNGGDNGNHGLIGGNGGVEHQPVYSGSHPGEPPTAMAHPEGANAPAQRPSENNVDPNRGGQENRDHFGNPPQDRSRMSGDGRANRMESNRGHASMAARRPPMRMSHPHPPAMHAGGGGRRR